MDSPKRIKFYFILYSTFILLQIISVTYFHVEISSVIPISGISIFISFLILVFEAISLAKFISTNYEKELKEIIPKRHKSSLYSYSWVFWFATSEYDFGKEDVRNRKKHFLESFILIILYIFVFLPISNIGLGIYQMIPRV